MIGRLEADEEHGRAVADAGVAGLAGIQQATVGRKEPGLGDVSQTGLFPSNCRLLDPGEASNAGVSDGSSVLLVGFESADHPVDAWMARALECCADHGGTVPDGVRSSSEEGTAGAWRSSFLRAPYGRDAMVALACIAETFETACTWDAFDNLHATVTESV